MSAQATASLVDVFGVQPALGRWFSEEEDQPNGRKVVVLKYANALERAGVRYRRLQPHLVDAVCQELVADSAAASQVSSSGACAGGRQNARFHTRAMAYRVSRLVAADPATSAQAQPPIRSSSMAASAVIGMAPPSASAPAISGAWV